MYRKSNVPASVSELPAYLDAELSRIEQSQMTPAPFVQLSISYTPPVKIADGMVVLADGVQWDPGAGPGVYCRLSGVWRLLG